jgi:small subunit ribosomal protein S16
MLRIKLSRRGKKKQPVYRILVIEKQKDPWGTFIENVGIYNPRTEPDTVELKEDRIKHWLSVGAKPTNTVHNLLVDAGIITEKKVRGSNLGKKYKEKVKAEAEAAKEAEAKAKESDSAEATPDKEAEAPKESDSAEASSDKEAKAEEPKAEEKPAEAESSSAEAADDKKKEEPKSEEKKEDTSAEEKSE